MIKNKTKSIYLWQLDSWPEFSFDKKIIQKSLKEAKEAQAYILAQQSFFETSDEAEVLIEEALTTSAIEGEKLDRESIRSSVAKRLGLPTAGLPRINQKSDGVVEILIDATQNYSQKLTHKRLHAWHACLFPTGYSGMSKIHVASYRAGDEPMRVVSGPIDQENVHFLAPPSKIVSKEMTRFLSWWNDNEIKIDGILKAAIAHLWFLTIHPFEDGNGRIARVLTDMALSSNEKTARRLYSLSFQILNDKKSYYEILERTQKGSGDITEWLVWFLDMYVKSIDHSKGLIEKTFFIAKFYKLYADKDLNVRQWKVLKKLLEQFPKDFVGGLTNKKYVAMTGTSSETAKRDLKELLEKGAILMNEGKGRSTSYRLNTVLAL